LLYLLDMNIFTIMKFGRLISIQPTNIPEDAKIYCPPNPKRKGKLKKNVSNIPIRDRHKNQKDDFLQRISSIFET